MMGFAAASNTFQGPFMSMSNANDSGYIKAHVHTYTNVMYLCT